jgi:hypothetical protein
MKTDARVALNLRIAELEALRKIQFDDLNSHFRQMTDGLKPMNILRKAIHDMTQLPDLKEGIGNVAIGTVTGIIAKKVFWGNSFNPLRMLMGVLTQTLVANVTAKNADGIREKGVEILQPFLHRFFQRRRKHKAEALFQEQVY